MLKKLLQIILLTTTLFSYEIVIDKTSQIPKELVPKWGATFTRDDAKEVVVNDKTGLMWQDDKTAKTVKKDWQGAKDYCQALNFAGFDDWYLPRISELETLINTIKYDPAIKDGFKHIISSFYWSSSLNVYYSKYAWYIYFRYGGSDNGSKADKRYIRCVRIGQ